MPRIFSVEDGTGKADATSYATVAQFQQYWLDRGITLSTADVTNAEAYLNQASDYIDTHYDFIGAPTYPDVQALEWPRYISEQSGLQRKIVDSDEIPAALIKAVCWLAYQVRNGQLDTVKSSVISESYGGVSKQYAEAGNTKRYEYIDKRLSNYLISGTPLQRIN